MIESDECMRHSTCKLLCFQTVVSHWYADSEVIVSTLENNYKLASETYEAFEAGNILMQLIASANRTI